MTIVLLVFLSILPVAVLMIIMYKMDKFQKEPIKSLVKAFLGGALGAIGITTILDLISYKIFPSPPMWYEMFITAGVFEEMSKFLIFMIFIWRDKHFDEFFDGIVYASFISLGFACLENIGYVIMASQENSFGYGASVALYRAFYAVPGHFLDGILLGFFLSLAKFRKERRLLYIITGLALVIIVSHGLWDYLIELKIEKYVSTVTYYIASNTLYIVLWIVGVRFIRRHQKNTKLQFELAEANNQPTTENNEQTNT